jgi:hypothetical protein
MATLTRGLRTKAKTKVKASGSSVREVCLLGTTLPRQAWACGSAGRVRWSGRVYRATAALAADGDARRYVHLATDS